MKIIHIHSSSHFIDRLTKIFENSSFENKILFLGISNNYNGRYKEQVKYYKPNKQNVKRIITASSKVDVVVLYSLDGIKSYIANRLPANVLIIWRFFGLELYGKMSDYVFSDSTLGLLHKMDSKKEKLNIWSGKIRPFLSKVRWGTIFDEEIEKAIVRIDYFLALSEVEYLFLKKTWPSLPSFMQHPYSFMEAKDITKKRKNNIIVLGNNRSAYNNHLDIFELISANKNEKKYSFHLMFNYGMNNFYSNSVRKEAQKIKSITIRENLMPFDEYQKFYMTVDAFVLNGFRQMAMGAVFESLLSSVKVYLNKKNHMLEWLRTEGFMIFDLEDFSYDLSENNLFLSGKEAQINIETFDKFRRKYNLEGFQKELIELINRNQ